ncbi:MAG: hypothetical protein ACYC8V_09190 [Caulobacteraceae bacterium]
MPTLANRRCESFARLVAAGATLADAYDDAGFAPANRHAARLAQRPEVAERIAELRAEAGGLTEACAPAVVAGLLRIVKAGEELKTPAAMKEGRVTMLEAWKVAVETARLRQIDRAQSGLDDLVGDSEPMRIEDRIKALRKWEPSLA